MKSLPAALCLTSALMTSAAQAALPRIATDSLDRGEWTLQLSHRQYSQDGPTRLTYTSPAMTLSGTREYEYAQTALGLATGITDKLELELAGGLRTTTESIQITSPGPGSIDGRDTGLTDLSLRVDYRLEPREGMAIKPGVWITLPTASDAPGTSGQTVNGIVIVSRQSGGAGYGVTSGRAFIEASVRKSDWALGGGGSVRASDDDSSRFETRASATLTWLPSNAWSTGLNLAGGHLDSSNNDGHAFQRSFGYREVAWFGELRPGDGGLSLSLILWQQRLSGAATKDVASGHSFEFGAADGRGGMISVTFLLN